MGNYTPSYSLSASSTSAIVVCSGKGVSLLLERSVSSPTDPLHQTHILPTEVQKCSICETCRAKEYVTQLSLDYWERCSFLSLCSPFSQWSEDDELADAKQNSEWMDECQDGMFEAWYEKIAQEEPEKQRKVSPLSGVIGSDWEYGEERLQGGCQWAVSRGVPVAVRSLEGSCLRLWSGDRGGGWGA